MKTKQYWYRLLHRDLGYFYLGLILCFSISGIALNHRDSFDSQSYVFENKKIQLEVTDSLKIPSEDYLKSVLTPQVDSDFRGARIEKDKARVYFKDAFAFVNLKSGEAEVEFFRTIPVLGHMSILHKSMDKWWVWFSDIFALALIVISITGVLLSRGKYSFKRRGWILTTVGLLFPIIILFLIS